jgi:hypothetical protein
MDKANKHDLRLLIRWLVHQEGGRGFLDGIEYEVWDEKLIEDLVSISGRASSDGFLRWFQEHLLPWLPRRIFNIWTVSVTFLACL